MTDPRERPLVILIETPVLPVVLVVLELTVDNVPEPRVVELKVMTKLVSSVELSFQRKTYVSFEGSALFAVVRSTKTLSPLGATGAANAKPDMSRKLAQAKAKRL